MALLFCDNFQLYGTGASPSPMTDGVYATVQQCQILDDPDTNITQNVLQIRDGFFQDGTLRKVLPYTLTTGSALGVGFRIWFDALPSLDSGVPTILSMHDSGNIPIMGIRVRTDGYLEVARGGYAIHANRGGTIVATSSAPCIVAGAWQQIEMKVVIHASAGSVEIRVDGTVVLNATGLNTGNADCTQIAHVSQDPGGSNSGAWPYYKDYFIWDTTGSLNNNFLGNCFVYSMIPDGDVSGTWSVTGGSGPAYDAINDTAPDDDTSYISSAFPAATPEVVTVSDLPTEATRVLGMMTLIHSKKTDGGDANLQVSLVSATNTVDGSDRPITVAYTYWTDVFETDPDTSAAWTVSAANAAKLKFNRTA